VNDLEEARAMLQGLAGQHAVLGKLASGTLKREDLPALQKAAADLGLDTVSEALGQLASGKSPAAILTYLLASGDFPDLMPHLVELRSTVDDVATMARVLSLGRRP
jgi:hypothetical protein